MPFNGSGVFTSLYSWVQDAANGIDISSTRMDAQEADYTTNGFGNCLTRDGQGSASANLPMNTHRHTNVGNAVAVTDYAAAGQIQSNAILFAVGAGTGDAITAALSPAVTALVDGMQFAIRSPGTNTVTTPTFAPNGLTANTITKFGGVALAAGDIQNGAEIILRYVSGSTRWELLNPNIQVSSVSLSANNTWTGTQTFNQAGGTAYPQIAGNTSGAIILTPPAAGGGAITFPSGARTLASLDGTEALTNKTLNGTTFTATSPGSTVTLNNGIVFTVSNTLTLTSVNGATLAIGAGGTLGSAAYVSTGTSGAAVPLLNGNNTFSGTAAFTGATLTFNSLNVGYLEVPDSAGSGANSYTCVLADSGTMVRISGATKTVTIPANASVAYPVGTTLTFFCSNASGLSIAITSDTMTLANTTNTGTRTLARNGLATALKLTSTTWVISGVGIS